MFYLFLSEKVKVFLKKSRVQGGLCGVEVNIEN